MANFTMPKPDVGEVVFFYPQGAETVDLLPAMVLHVGEETLSISVFVRDAMALQPKDGVRYVKDPKLNLPECRENGAWGFRGAKSAISGETVRGPGRPRIEKSPVEA